MPRVVRWLPAVLLFAGLLVILVVAAPGYTPATIDASPGSGAVREEAFYGPALQLGNGQVRTYARLHGRQPVDLGFVFGRDTLSGLPTLRSDGRHCHDRSGDGQIDPDTECVAEHEFMLELPEQFTRRVGGPFTWAMLTWDPYGHAPEQAYGAPHFDLHFYLQDRAATEAIRSGPCGGANLINCDDYRTGRIPVPERYVPAGYIDIDAVVPGMGNHLGDPAAQEFHGQPFTHTFMAGAYGGRITFYEPMVTKSWFEQLAGGRPGSCTPIKQPAAWQVAGWYPNTYCIEYHATQQRFTVSMRDFAFHPAS